MTAFASHLTKIKVLEVRIRTRGVADDHFTQLYREALVRQEDLANMAYQIRLEDYEFPFVELPNNCILSANTSDSNVCRADHRSGGVFKVCGECVYTLRPEDYLMPFGQYL